MTGSKKVAVIEIPGHYRSKIICRAMGKGIATIGDEPIRFTTGNLHAVEECDAAVFYGFVQPLPQVMQRFKETGRAAVHIDLGYWGRLENGRYSGFHKVVVNARHPDAYFQEKIHPDDRVKHFDIRRMPWKKHGKNIILAGMSGKHSKSEGWKPQKWETEIVSLLKQYTDRPILYRPKPGDKFASPIPGTEFIQGGAIESYFDDCWALVTHHSNAAIDAAIAGVPSFSVQGVATKIGLTNFSLIESPRYPELYQWLADIAYCQFNIQEMLSGECWSHLRSEGLIP